MSGLNCQSKYIVIASGRALARTQGFLEEEITLSTYHIIDRGEPEGRILRVIYGEGEHLFCWMDISTEVIVWHALPASRGSKTQTRMRFKATGTIS